MQETRGGIEMINSQFHDFSNKYPIKLKNELLLVTSVMIDSCKYVEIQNVTWYNLSGTTGTAIYF